MKDDIETGLIGLRRSWMTGSAPPEALPQDWKALAETDQSPALVYLALAGQAIECCFEIMPPQDMKETVPLPVLDQPTLPDSERIIFRRALEDLSSVPYGPAALIRLMANRGWVAHPSDWMPARSADQPQVYAPWLDWLSSNASTTEDDLTLANWANWAPAERRHQMIRIRDLDPSKARDMLAARLQTEKAEDRLRLLELMANRLGPDDIPFLRTLSEDRSARVKNLSAIFLARLGEGSGDAGNARELADFLALKSKGLLSKRKELTSPALKTNAQRVRRGELFEMVTLSDLARAFDMTAKDTVEAFRCGPDPMGTLGFVLLVANTGSDECVGLLNEKLLTDPDSPAAGLHALLLRISETSRRPFLTAMMSRRDASLEYIVASAGMYLGTFTLNEQGASGVTRKLEAWARSDDEKNRNQKPELSVSRALAYLGLLADAKAADGIVEKLVGIGMLNTDPLLNTLRFNASLKKS